MYFFSRSFSLIMAILTCFVISLPTFGQDGKPVAKADPPAQEISTTDFKQIYSADFESGIADWELLDDGWQHLRAGNSQVLGLVKKQSNYSPTHRSPTHIALLKGNAVTDFQLDLRIQSTHEDYDHRDVCLFFGYQSPDEYYYVHLGKKTDPHCNQIFIVNRNDRTKISATTSEGTNWDKRWHSVRLQRSAATGEIRVFFDDMNNPVMTAKDNTFTHGRIGVGSFDDTANFDNLKLTGKALSTENKEVQSLVEKQKNNSEKPAADKAPDKTTSDQ